MTQDTVLEKVFDSGPRRTSQSGDSCVFYCSDAFREDQPDASGTGATDTVRISGTGLLNATVHLPFNELGRIDLNP